MFVIFDYNDKAKTNYEKLILDPSTRNSLCSIDKFGGHVVLPKPQCVILSICKGVASFHGVDGAIWCIHNPIKHKCHIGMLQVELPAKRSMISYFPGFLHFYFFNGTVR